MTNEVITSLDIKTDIVSFTVWLTAHVNEHYSSVFKLRALHPSTPPWALEKSGIDPWSYSDSYIIPFEQHSMATSWMLSEPGTVLFEITRVEESAIRVEISSSISDDPYLNELIGEIEEHALHTGQHSA